MTNTMKPSEFDYVERPKQFDRDDFWQQVRRTINGQPVAQEQIQLIVDQVAKGLALEKDDHLLDIGCGNGALTVEFGQQVSDVMGLDYSEYLIGVAREYFESSRMRFSQMSIEKLITGDLNRSFNKALLYGVSSYLSDELLQNLIAWYFSNNKGILFIGNIRNRMFADDFYKEEKSEMELQDHTTSIGKWRTQQWFESLAKNIGVQLEFMKMPDNFYLSRFYLDAVFTRPL